MVSLFGYLRPLFFPLSGVSDRGHAGIAPSLTKVAGTRSDFFLSFPLYCRKHKKKKNFLNGGK